MLLKYSQVESDFHEPIVKECRGLIIDKNTLQPAALSFYKFFNVQEPLADRIYWKDCRVQEKVDGSKILVWYDKYRKNWRVSTSGMLNADDAKVNDFGTSFLDLFDEAIINAGCEMWDDFTKSLHEGFCYTFELVSPESRIVVPYKETEIYLIGMRRVSDAHQVDGGFQEVSPEDLNGMNSQLLTMCKRPKEYKLDSLNACLNATNKMGFDEEGFVVVDKYWNRVKIKSPAYVAAHHLRDNGSVNRDKILTIIEQGEQDEFLGYFPEYKKYFDEIAEKRKKFLDNLVFALIDIYTKKDTLKDEWSRKDFAKYIMEKYPNYKQFLFRLLDVNLIDVFANTEWNKLSNDKKLEYLDKVES
ncbi:RNA ligase [uncultured Clostridium sp.]|uniref:RNA ligase n=1 Tax=uncultured Clostridium sp. TaxID=59620 RepID=UPI0026EFF029|nr:RNA ligase [uncultured Clostridium sp.]